MLSVHRTLISTLSDAITRQSCPLSDSEISSALLQLTYDAKTSDIKRHKFKTEPDFGMLSAEIFDYFGYFRLKNQLLNINFENEFVEKGKPVIYLGRGKCRFIQHGKEVIVHLIPDIVAIIRKQQQLIKKHHCRNTNGFLFTTYRGQPFCSTQHLSKFMNENRYNH